MAKSYTLALSQLRDRFTPAELVTTAKVCIALADIDKDAGWMGVGSFGKQLRTFDEMLIQARTLIAREEAKAKKSQG